jgi:UDP-N-acetylmuramate-alanine ligase
VEKPADIRAEDILMRGEAGSEFDVVGDGFRHHAVMPLVGAHNVLNALAAVAVAVAHGICALDGRRGAGHALARRQARRSAGSRRRHHRQRLLQFESKGAARDGGSTDRR